MKEQFVLVHAALAAADYLSWFSKRGVAQPPLSSHVGVFVADAEAGLLCGCLIFPTEGPYFFVEHLATNPDSPPKLTHSAVERAANCIRVYAAVTSKIPIMLIQAGSGMNQILERCGFKAQTTSTYVAEPTALLKYVPEQEKPAPLPAEPPKVRAHRKKAVTP